MRHLFPPWIQEHAAPRAPDRARAHSCGGRHWESWALRALLAVLVVVQLLSGNRDGAVVAAMGLVIALAPVAITHLSGWHVPRMLELSFVLAMFLQYASESLKLFERLTYWDKIVHPAEIFLAAGVATYLLIGYAERHGLDIPDGLGAAGAMLFGIALGATWELVEFAFDWFGNANLQKSNADTLTDILTNNAGAVFGTLLALWLYHHRATEHERDEFGGIAEWLTGRLRRLLARHGFAVGLAVAIAIGAIVAAGWLMDRGPLPPPPAAQGAPQTWAFGASAPAPGPTAVVLGEWQAATHGICRVNREPPQPGSEQMGLLALGPGASYGSPGGYALSTRYRLDRPPLGAGTAMEAGLAFGVRGPGDFYLLRVSATHDVITLERYLHGRKRWQREERVRTQADEWHDLRLEVRDDHVAAYLDNRPVFAERGLHETAGGIGLWARVTTTACFQEARAAPLTSAL